jgi:acylphosphatase
MENKAFHAIIHGRVQGVAFRYYTRSAANQLSLSGWVRNLPDGTVEVHAEGPQDKLGQLSEWLKKGPAIAIVNKLDLTWTDPKGEADPFEIRA